MTTVCTEQLLGMTQELNMEQGNIEIQETHVPLDDQEEMMDQKHVGHEEQVLLVNEEHSDIEMIKEESDGQVIEDYQQDDSNQMQVSKEQEILLHS